MNYRIRSIYNLIDNSFDILLVIMRKREIISNLPKTHRYNGFLEIVELQKKLNRLNVLIEIKKELRKL